MLNRYEIFSSSISSIYHFIEKIERNEMVRYGGKGPFAQYLAALQRHPQGLTAAQLSDICDRDKAAVSRAVNEMEEMGLLEKKSGSHAYRAPLMLTEKGREAAEFVCRQACAAVEAGGKGLSEEERRILYTSLELIARNLEAISREGIPEK